jgi:mannuronan synthase
VASIVEKSDEFLIKEIFRNATPPGHVQLDIVRIPGTGKRDGLAHGFRAISRLSPNPDAVAIVMDGDTVLGPDVIRKCVPFFALNPKLGALTTDEISEGAGSKTFRDWYDMRFAQRQINMASFALSQQVLVLTGRMSLFRADVVTDSSFIDHVENDSIEHWFLGHFKFLTGDDKSSWYWLLQRGYQMTYLPDVQVTSIEDQIAPTFLKSANLLMFRWFGNMLRNNGRAIGLGPARMGLFTWWCLVDQRLSIWTTMTGPVFALFLTLKHGLIFIPFFIVWIGFTRWVQSLILLNSRYELNWRYPFLLYFSQVYGAFLKTFIMFRLDRQSWTRQKTTLNRDLSLWQRVLQRYSSVIFHLTSLVVFLALIGIFSGTFVQPQQFVWQIIGFHI